MEEMVYDNGRLVNPTLADYMIPSFLDVPASFTTTILRIGTSMRCRTD